ncbi:methyl-accepting chemotaxis protein [Methylobacterium bullatum]|uniref:Methyl-accepting chemotaxis protein PctA n=1 Tax=Methylobacterium bullatum TaxID=570505 RepID=A0A679JDH1_9HYPH|nr:Methyl-accepting chemotaxis protein PctA [Methylobacterium bullatum]
MQHTQSNHAKFTLKSFISRLSGVSAKATLLIVSALFFVLIAASLYLYASQSEELEASIEQRARNIGNATASNVGNWLKGKSDLAEFAAQQITKGLDTQKIDKVLGSPAMTKSFILSSFGDVDGNYTKIPKGPISPGYDARERPWYKAGAQAKSFALTEPYLAASTQTMTITISAPVFDDAKKLFGVVGNDFDVVALSKMINEVEIGGFGYAYLVSATGNILVHSKQSLLGKNMSHLISGDLPPIKPVFSEVSEDGRPTLMTFVRVPNLPPSMEWYVALSIDQHKAFAPVKRLQLMMIAGTFGTLAVIAFIVSQLMARTVARPLKGLVNVLERMSAGEVDTNIEATDRSDEIGAVGRAVEAIKKMVEQKAADVAERDRIAKEEALLERKRTMMEMADNFEKTFSNVVGIVASSATELQATAQTMTATAGQTSDRSLTVAAAAEQAAVNVNTVAAAAEELGSSVQEIGRQVHSSADLAQRAVAEANHTGQLVEELSGSVIRIDAVVDMISSIASQTNLLALNATIEAARAGDAGRGFAVVAAEVKELANQTAQATKEISAQIAGVQGSTEQTVRAIGIIEARLREMNDVATAIASAVEEQGAATQEIVRNVAEAAHGTSEVTSNISGIAGAAEETGAAASQVLSAASELSQHSEYLSLEVSRFLKNVRAA